MGFLYVSRRKGRSGGLATAISGINKSDSSQFVDKVKASYEFPADCEGVVIVGDPEPLFGSQQKYQKFLVKAEKRDIKVAGISVHKDMPSFPNNNQGLGKFIQSGGKRVTNIAKELAGFFG